MSEWQPIETAPWDYSVALAYIPNSHRPVQVIELDRYADEWIAAGITHWLPIPCPPLPEPPK